MGFIYKLLCNKSGKCYIGSSKSNLKKRLSSHKAKSNKCYSREIIENNDFQFIILEENIDDNELKNREYFFITTTECVNKNKPYVIGDDKKLRNNKKEIERYYSNIDYYKEKSKEYYYDNKQKIREKYNTSISCECGKNYTLGNKSRHLNSLYHKNNITIL